MKTSIVPAQITTVEDRIAGNLTLQQMVLLAMPFFLGFVAYVALPPNLNFALYKLGLVLLLLVVFGLLAIRVREKILLFWLITIVRYNSRSRYYVYDKRDGFLRDVTPPADPAQKTVAKTEQKAAKPSVEQPKLSVAEMVQIETLLAHPDAKLHFMTNKKGALNVHITEVKQ